MKITHITIYCCFREGNPNVQTWLFDFAFPYGRRNTENDNRQQPFHEMYSKKNNNTCIYYVKSSRVKIYQ